jgi:hypothetical protein
MIVLTCYKFDCSLHHGLRLLTYAIFIFLIYLLYQFSTDVASQMSQCGQLFLFTEKLIST